jgi:hypothetical protein
VFVGWKFRDNDSCMSNFGEVYELPEGVEQHSDEARSMLAGDYIWKCAEVEVF